MFGSLGQGFDQGLLKNKFQNISFSAFINSKLIYSLRYGCGVDCSTISFVNYTL